MLGDPLKQSSSVDRMFALCLVVMAVILSAVTFQMGFRNLSPVPSFDDWGFLDPSSLWFGLFALHSEHRIVLSKLVFLADMRFLPGQHIAEFAVDALMLLSLGAAYWGAVKLEPGSNPMRAALAAAIFLCFAISPLTVVVLLWAMHVQNVGVNVCALFAFLCLARSARARPEDKISGYLLLAAAIFFGGFASLVSSPGVLVPILLIPQAALLGMRRRVIAGLALLALASTWYYLHGNPAQGNLIGALKSTPVLVGKFFLAFLGSFVTQALRRSDAVAYLGLTICIGAVSIAILALNTFVFVNRYRNERGSFPDFALFTLTAAAFYLMSAALVAGGRTSYGISYAYTEHYNILRALYWANLLISVPACWNSVRAWTLVSALALCAAIAFAAWIPGKSAEWAYWSASLNQGGAAIASDVYDVSAWGMVSLWDKSNPSTVPFEESQEALLRRTGQSVFHDTPPLWLARQVKELPILDRSCSGSILTVESGRDLKGTYVTVKGWVRAVRRSNKLPQIVLTDIRGEVRGFGALEPNIIGKVSWVGYARLDGAPGDAYFFQAGELCRLAGVAQ